MKGFTVFILILWINGLQAQQDSTARPTSKYDKFLSRTGVMFKMEEISLGKGRMAEVIYHKATNLEDGKFSESVAIGGYGTSFWSSSNVLRVDKDELSDVIKALEYYRSMFSRKATNKEWYNYVTANRITVQCTYQPVGIWKGWSISIAQYYLYYSGIIPGSSIVFREKDIEELLQLLKQAQNTTIAAQQLN